MQSINEGKQQPAACFAALFAPMLGQIALRQAHVQPDKTSLILTCPYNSARSGYYHYSITQLSDF